MTNIDVCNMALDIIGQGGQMTSFDEMTPEAEMCKRHFMPTYQAALEQFNWTFARRDEVIDEENWLKDVCVLPYAYAYSIPEDVMRILYLTEVNAPSITETMGNREAIQFNFRNYDNKKVLATDHKPGFAMHYQAFIEDVSACSPSFTYALTYLLASRLASGSLGSNDRLTIGVKLYQVGYQLLTQAAAQDAQQGNYSVDNFKYSSFIRSRTRGRGHKWR